MTEDRKTRIKIPKENKTRAELQKQIGSTCPFCISTDVGHFEVHHIDENPANNNIANLLLLCPTCHSKITKGDISQIETFKKKITLLTSTPIVEPPASKTISFNAKVENAFVGDNNTISIKQSKTVKQKYPEGCIGFDTMKANYVVYLIKRYNEYKEYEVGKAAMNYAAFQKQLKNKFYIYQPRTLYNLPIKKFDELTTYIHSKINGTKLARMNGRGHKNYSTFEEYNNRCS